MNRRTLILLGAAGLIGVFYFGDYAYRTFIEKPMQRDETQLAKYQKNLTKAKDAQIEAKKASRTLETLLEHSLPSDPEMAKSAYQDWLLKLVQSQGLEDSSVDPKTPVPVAVKSRTKSGKKRLVYHRLNFGLHARGRLDQVTAFMYQFYQAGHLHQIKSVSLNPIGQGDRVDCTISIEAIAMADCEREGTLTESTLDRLAYDSPQDYQFISQRNMFARGFSKALSQVQLTAVTFDRRGVGQAWFQLGAGQDTQIASPGETLAVELFEIDLVDVQNDVVIVKVNGEVVRLELGQSLSEAMELKRSGATASR